MSKILIENTNNGEGLQQDITTTRFNYMGSPISFKQDGELLINANHMAKPFGKLPTDFLRLQQTQDFMDVLGARLTMGFPIIKKEVGRYGGTWMHQKLALKFAAWLSPDFELWVYDRIEELLETGKTELHPQVPQTFAQALRLAADQSEQLVKQEKELQQKKQLLLEAQPKVEAFEDLMTCANAITMQEVAGVLAFKGMGRNNLFQFLRKKGILDMQNTPYRYYIESGWFKLNERPWTNPQTGERTVATTTVVMQKGVDGIRKMLRKEGY